MFEKGTGKRNEVLLVRVFAALIAKFYWEGFGIGKVSYPYNKDSRKKSSHVLLHPYLKHINKDSFWYKHRPGSNLSVRVSCIFFQSDRSDDSVH